MTSCWIFQRPNSWKPNARVYFVRRCGNLFLLFPIHNSLRNSYRIWPGKFKKKTLRGRSEPCVVFPLVSMLIFLKCEIWIVAGKGVFGSEMSIISGFRFDVVMPRKILNLYCFWQTDSMLHKLKCEVNINNRMKYSKPKLKITFHGMDKGSDRFFESEAELSHSIRQKT